MKKQTIYLFAVPNRKLPDLSIAEIVDVRRLEYLCRCHILLAFMARRNQPEHDVFLQKASWFMLRLWQVNRSNVVHWINQIPCVLFVFF